MAEKLQYVYKVYSIFRPRNVTG